MTYRNHCIVCGKPCRGEVCSHHLVHHDPVPEHHVAQERPCLRCGEGFESTWSGDRICPRCRERQKDWERRGYWHDNPFEPAAPPGLV